jgi:hypothetical protein
MIKKNLPVALGLACAASVFAGPGTISNAQALPVVIGPGPILCAWDLFPSPTLNVSFNAFGYTGHERRIRIHSGNYDTTNNVIDYTVEVIWDPNGCSGEEFTVRFPLHGLSDHIEIEVLDSGGLIGGITSDLGALPDPFDSARSSLTQSNLGPFVITDTMATQMGRTVAFFLLDTQILSRLPEPHYYNGALPTNVVQEFFMGLAYAFAVDQNQDLYEYFAWRRDLVDMSSSAQSRAATAINDHIYDAGEYAATVWEDHTGVLIDHGIGYEPRSGHFGGFWNGHRHYLAGMEAYFASLSDSERTPFRRLPAYNPADTIPSDFNIGISDTTPSVGVGTGYQSSNICGSYPASASGAATYADQLLDMQEVIYSDVNLWHGSVHGAIGGDMGTVVTAARAPIFFPWHGAVDAIWRNWQLCEAAWDDSTYSW